MTESIKHGIVLLQIAKNATLPEVQFKAKQQSGNISLNNPKAKIKHADKPQNSSP